MEAKPYKHPAGMIDWDSMLDLLEGENSNFPGPNSVAFSVLFPGQLYGAFRCGQYFKKALLPEIKIMDGWRIPNHRTPISQERGFLDYCDYIVLGWWRSSDPITFDHLEGKKQSMNWSGLLVRIDSEVKFFWINSAVKDIASEIPRTPDYSDLRLRDYLSVLIWK